MNEVLLDTDILSEVLKRKDQKVLVMARQYLFENQRLAFSAMTVYEVVRGMRARGATRQLSVFLKIVETSDVLPVSLSVLLCASELWAEARKAGHPQNDADLIIAATALQTGRVLVTGNTSHFSWVSGLQIADWRIATNSPRDEAAES